MPTRGSKTKLSSAEAAAWKGFLRANVRLRKALEADLLRSHGLPIGSYDALVALWLAPRRRLRMTELAEQVYMSPGNLTRIVDQLEREGSVERERRADDARSFDAVLTIAGRTRVRAANVAHLAAVRALFLDRLSDEQLDALAAAWAAIDRALVDA